MTLLAATSHAQNSVAVIAHRGDRLNHGENTLEGFRAAADGGANYIEVDVRTTVDGKLVLMHDSTVDRTTDGHGEISSLTFDQLRKLRVNKVSQIPTFDEALTLARDRGIGVYVDSKAVSAVDAAAAIARNNMTDRVVIYGREEYLRELAAIQPKLRVMPEARDAATLQRLLDSMKLKVVAFDARDFVEEVIAIARKAGVDIYVDRLGDADNEKSWEEAVTRGATGIQSDHPAKLAAFLKSRFSKPK